MAYEGVRQRGLERFDVGHGEVREGRAADADDLELPQSVQGREIPEVRQVRDVEIFELLLVREGAQVADLAGMAFFDDRILYR